MSPSSLVHRGRIELCAATPSVVQRARAPAWTCPPTFDRTLGRGPVGTRAPSFEVLDKLTARRGEVRICA